MDSTTWGSGGWVHRVRRLRATTSNPTRVVLGAHPDPAGRRRAGQRRRPNGRVLDIANGMATRVSPAEVAFPNLDLTLHLLPNRTASGSVRHVRQLRRLPGSD
ncbi:hypothetical protein GS474_06865 [Rhodococcus hoagii]|nr:hypothetical protein [Prescottella equi]